MDQGPPRESQAQTLTDFPNVSKGKSLTESNRVVHSGLLLFKFFLQYLILKNLVANGASKPGGQIADSVQSIGAVIYIVPVGVLIYGMICILISDVSIL